jgi:hypothetical protein
MCSGELLTKARGEEVIMKLILKNRRRYSKREAVLLLGARLYQDTFARYLYRNPHFAALKDWEEEEIEEAIDSLLSLGRIRLPKRGFWKGKLTASKRTQLPGFPGLAKFQFP